MKELRPLAELMKNKKESGDPYILCLGEGATLSSGCRLMREAVRETIKDERPWALDEVLARLDRPERCGEDKDEFLRLLGTISEEDWYDDLLDEFFALLENRSSVERERLLSRFLAEHYPAPGYSFISVLAREGFFDVILNANYDALLQHALDGHLPNRDQQGRLIWPSYKFVINLADPSVAREIDGALGLRSPRIKVIWLHGYFAGQSEIAFTQEEKDRWYDNIRDSIEELFSQDLLLVGYTDRDYDIRRAVDSAHRGGTIWYVAPERPKHDMAGALRGRRKDHHRVISGQAADFDTFFQVIFELALDLEDPMRVVQEQDPHRRRLLLEKRDILGAYVQVLSSRQQADQTAPPTVQAQKEALQREIAALDDALNATQERTDTGHA